MKHLQWVEAVFSSPVPLNKQQRRGGGGGGGGGGQRARRRARCVTFQRSEVRAPLFPIQPMLWVLFQKVLSLSNGPCSREQRQSPGEEEEEEEEEAARSRQPGNRRRRKRRKSSEVRDGTRDTTSLHRQRGGAQPNTTTGRPGDRQSRRDTWTTTQCDQVT